jgi:hypothetical protein
MKRNDHMSRLDVSQLVIRPTRSRGTTIRTSGRRTRPVLPA